jgi:hypothetical protein
MPLMNVAMYTTSSKKLKGVWPHMLYQNTFYKGSDYSFCGSCHSASKHGATLDVPPLNNEGWVDF